MNKKDDIIYEAQLHWMIFLPTFKLILLTFGFVGVVQFFDITSMFENFGLPWWINLATFGVLLIFVLNSLIRQAITQITTRVYLTSDKLFLRAGWFNVQQMELPLAQIESTSISQDFWGKIFGYGSVSFFGTGGRQPVAYWIKSPELLTHEIGRSEQF